MLAVVCGVLISGGISFAATLTFDDLQTDQPVPNGYGGLDWGNFWVFAQNPNDPGTGLDDGVVSSPNIAANGYYWYGSITAPSGTTFTLNSAYLTACWWWSISVEVTGYLEGSLMFDCTYNLSPTTPLLAEFPSAVVDSVNFTVNDSSQFVMDNLTINAAEHMVPWKGKSKGQLTPDMTGAGLAYAIAEAGNATHVGNFTEVGTPDPTTGVTWITITAANNDELYGVVVGTSGSLPVVEYNIVIFDGTGHFQGAQGSYVETLTIDPATLEFTATSAGTINN